MRTRATVGGSVPGPFELIAHDDPRAAGWDDFLAGTAGGSHQQTDRWAVLKQLQGWRSTTVVLGRDGRIVAGALLLLKPLPVVPWSGQMAYCAKGPIASDPDPHLLDAVVDAVLHRCREHAVRFLILQPPERGPDLVAALVRRGLVESPIAVAPEASVVVDLRPGPEAVERRLTTKHRSNMRRAARRGIAVRAGGRPDLPALHRLLVDAGGRLGYEVYPLEYFERMWDLFAGGDGMCLLLAEHEGRPVSALLCLAFGDTAYRKNSGWSGELSGLASNDLLDLEAVAWATRRGLVRYDLEGIPYPAAVALARGADPSTLDLEGAVAYKLKWGGEVEVFPRPRLYVPGRPARSALGRALTSRRLRRGLRRARVALRTPTTAGR